MWFVIQNGTVSNILNEEDHHMQQANIITLQY